MSLLTINQCSELAGEVTIPADKSISHRALMFASLALGTSKITNLLEGHDCLATLKLMQELGIKIIKENNYWLVHGKGRAGLCEPQNILDCQNSGTTMRLMSGLLSAMNFFCVLDGTKQIKSRPMARVIEPLTLMGAHIYARENNTKAPIAILPSKLQAIDFTLQQKSAQVKSALILASLFSGQKSRITNTKATRDHTERMLNFMGANIEVGDDHVTINPLTHELKPLELSIVGDISSAAFLIVAGVLLAKDGILLKNVGVNHTRTGIIDALIKMGADIKIINKSLVANEDMADIFIKKSSLKAASFEGDEVARMIDEIPILALAATQAMGVSIIKDALELKVKESNRINKTVTELKKLGCTIEETFDGMIITGQSSLKKISVEHYGDHRLALMLSIAGLLCQDGLQIKDWQVMDDSFPGFIHILTDLGAKVEKSIQ